MSPAYPYRQAKRVGEIERIVSYVRIEVVATFELDRVFADESLEARRIVASSKIIEPCTIIFPPSECVSIARAGSGT
jgi:hypothetical protein